MTDSWAFGTNLNLSSMVSDAGQIELDGSTSSVLAVPRFGCWLDCALVSDAGWMVLDCSTSLVLAVPRFGCWLDCV